MNADKNIPKILGAYYTDSQIADFLVWWAVRSPSDRVLDPSFGGGVFLRSACKQLAGSQVLGVEIDPEVHARISEKLCDEFGTRAKNLRLGSFFDLGPGELARVDAIVGNPPFIRFHRFSGDVRRRALTRALEQGVRLSELASSWAAFLVHSVSFLRPGGRIAMVVPAEFAHAAYADAVLQHLLRSFQSVTILTFRKRLFPDVNEDTMLLLADGRGLGKGELLWRDLAHAGELGDLRMSSVLLPGTTRLDYEHKLVEQFVPRKARDLYRRLKESAETVGLGDAADVGIGYVTGANNFFHVSPEMASEWRIPHDFLRPAVRRGRALAGLRFTRGDWDRAATAGDAGYLLSIASAENLPDGLRRYIEAGEAQGVPKGYKCRNRSPWFRVPHVHHPDAFLTYMSGFTPRLVANDANAVAPNTLHVVRLHAGAELGVEALSVLWQTSLTRLSAEIEGHPLGGGMLKLEPTEAERVVVANATMKKTEAVGLVRELDRMIRVEKEQDAQNLVDQRVLRDGLGLSASDCATLQRATETLRNRRRMRTR
jgi:adenine-specific DNA-methyltransferase